MSVIINNLVDLLLIASTSMMYPGDNINFLLFQEPAFLPSDATQNRLRSYCNSPLHQMCSTLPWLLLAELQGYLGSIAVRHVYVGWPQCTVLVSSALQKRDCVTFSTQKALMCFLLWDYSTASSTGIIIASFISEKCFSVNKRYNESTNNGNACN